MSVPPEKKPKPVVPLGIVPTRKVRTKPSAPTEGGNPTSAASTSTKSKKQSPSSGIQFSSFSPPTEIAVGNVKVGPNGIEFIHSIDGTPKEGEAVGSPVGTPLRNLVDIDTLVRGRRLGQGNFGQVFKYEEKPKDVDSQHDGQAVDPSTTEKAQSAAHKHHKQHVKKYAVKEIPLKLSKDQHDRVVKELRAVIAQESKYAVKLHNAYIREKKLLLVMEYMNFGTLGELMRLYDPPRLPELATAYIASQILCCLKDLHERKATPDGFQKADVHRDIKPDNILLSRDGAIKLADFGVATSTDTLGADTYVGTVTYMSPERIKGERYGPASDIWSAGVVIAEILMGKFPFAAERVVTQFALLSGILEKEIVLPEDISREAVEFVAASTMKDQTRRLGAAELLTHPFIVKGLEFGANGMKKMLAEHLKRGQELKSEVAAAAAANNEAAT